MPLTVTRNELTAKFTQGIIKQIRNGVGDDMVIDLAEEPWMTDILYWTNEWDWDCETTINTGWSTNGIKWTFESEEKLAEFLLLFSLKWGNSINVYFA